MQTLKPCPFCGGRASHRQFTGNGFTLPRVEYTEVRCDKCEISTGPHQLLHHNGDRPLAAWNTRPAAPVEGLETIAWRDVNGKLYRRIDVRPGNGEPLVSQDKAEAIIAAERTKLTKEEADHTRSLEERDRYHDVADKLAQAIADRYKADIGEHSNINDPWQNALNLIEADNAAKVEQERLRFEGDLDKWMKIIGAGITGYQPEAYALMDLACQEMVKLRATNAALTARVKELEFKLSGFCEGI